MSPRGVSDPGTGARFRPRRLSIANDETLVLAADGAIERRDAAGAVLERRAAGDPTWPALAIRFGLHAAPTTVRPHGRDVPDSKPPA